MFVGDRTTASPLRRRLHGAAAAVVRRYSSVMSACCLDDDVASLADGDSTMIGERGVTLSGGQRQRVSVARAVYSDRDVYLLDDPLSAVDPGVALAVFRRVVVDLLAAKTVLLVTHQLQARPSNSRRLNAGSHRPPTTERLLGRVAL